MLGRQVRCPHCAQIVVAPPPVAASPEPRADPAKPISHTAPTPPSGVAPLHPPEGGPRPESGGAGEEDSNITFEKKTESADSILSEEGESDDEVFSSQTGSKVAAPIVPTFDPHPPPTPGADPSASKIPTLELRTPVEIIPAPVSASTLFPPPPPPEPVPGAAPTTTTNPFAFDSTLASHPAPAVNSPAAWGEAEPPVPESDAPAEPIRTRPPQAATGRSRLLIYALASYAVIATVLAIYGFVFRSSTRPEPGHPLSTIPDTFGEFDPAARRKVSQLKLDFDAPLPAGQQVALGRKLQIGQLEVEPVSVEKRPLTIVKEGKARGDIQRRVTKFGALVLHLRVTNTSADSPIYPLDPAFTRSAKMDDRPAMRLAIGRQLLYGGAIPWPFGESVRREYEEAQAQDDKPLKPGETRDYVVFTNEDSSLAQVIKKAGEPLVWRVQVRRGVIEFRGKDVPVSAIIGIEFNPSDIRNLE
jgi:hypothetical protein